MPSPVALLPLLITSALIAVLLRWRRVRSGPAGMSLAAEVALMTLGLFVLFCALLVVAQHLP
jgi:hypothetical protein